MNILLTEYPGSTILIFGMPIGYFILLTIIPFILAICVEIFCIMKTYRLAKKAQKRVVLWVIFAVLASTVALSILTAIILDEIDDTKMLISKDDINEINSKIEEIANKISVEEGKKK